MKIHELLDSPEKWTQHAPSRDIQGNVCDSNDPFACSWCLFGAILKCYGDCHLPIFNKLEKVTNCSFIAWNDDPQRTFEEVRELCVKLDI